MIKCNLSAILSKRRLKITEISKASGISRTTLTVLYYERCIGVKLETVSKLCNYLGCSVGELFENVSG